MVFQSVADLTAALAGTAALSGDRLTVTGTPSPDLVDRLAHTAAFGASPEVKGTARWVILNLAAHAGIRFASIHDLYLAMGRGEAGGFTVPAINVRAMAYDTGRAVIRAAEEARCRRVHPRDRPLGDRLHRAAAARVRGDHGGCGAARGLPRAALPAGRPRAGERQEARVTRARQGARHAARADPRGDRRRLLQHRHRHLDAGRSRPADAGRAAGGELRAGRRLHGLHPAPRARRA